ncbi:hypothetical protein [Actinotalea sp.]|uniref:hypothetical protein n=1 Tax=Actinotalea sp. TaxID=1872145 RepID=UPI003563DF1A
MTLPSIPPPVTPPPGEGLAAIATIAERRGQGWATFAATFDAPSAAWVHALTTGALVRSLEAATDWRTGEKGDFAPALIRLGAYGRAAGRRGEDAERARLVEAHAALVVGAGRDLEAAREACALLASWCAQESAAWSAREPARARALRVQQDDALSGAEGAVLREAGVALREQASGQPYTALAELLLAWLERESTGAGLSGTGSASGAAEPRG